MKYRNAFNIHFIKGDTMNLETRVKKISEVLGEERVLSTLKRLIQLEADHCLYEIEQIQWELIPFEKQYSMKSETAWNEYNKGRLGDDADVMEWMAVYENLIDFKEEYNRIIKCGLWYWNPTLNK